jgi:hypothetical protein
VVPQVLGAVKRAVDREPRPGRFLFAGEPLAPSPDTPDLRGYVELALESGFPEAAFLSSAASRKRWLESYIDHLLTRDARAVGEDRDPFACAATSKRSR